MKVAALLMMLCVAGLAQQSPLLTFIKSFPGSTPAYVEITVQKNGTGEYKEDSKDENPVKFQLGADEAAALFRGADTLNHFTRPVESGLKVASMGDKTFRYTSGNETHEVKFNYSEDADARALLDWFERIAETERNMIDLERSVKFDKLGVQKAILQIEMSRDQKRWIAQNQFLPMLDRVAKNESFMHMARARAAALADSIRGAKAQ